MDYSFVRKVVKNIPVVNAQKLYQTLTSNGIEVFEKKDDAYHNMTLDMISENNDLYVSAADLAAAIEYINELGLQEYLCKDTETKVNVAMSDVEKAEEEFYRKHKQNQLFALVIIAVVVIFMLMQFFLK